MPFRGIGANFRRVGRFQTTACCHDVPEPDPQSLSPWRCMHLVKECGVLQGLLLQEPNPGLRPCTPLRDSIVLRYVVHPPAARRSQGRISFLFVLLSTCIKMEVTQLHIILILCIKVICHYKFFNVNIIPKLNFNISVLFIKFI